MNSLNSSTNSLNRKHIELLSKTLFPDKQTKQMYYHNPQSVASALKEANYWAGESAEYYIYVNISKLLLILNHKDSNC